MATDNVCKFINHSHPETLLPLNFIFEAKASDSGKEKQYDYHIMHLVVSGRGLLRQGGIVHPLETGTLFFTLSARPYTIENTQELQYMYISFRGGRAEELFRRFGISLKQCIFPEQKHLLPLWQDSLMRAEESNIDLLSESLILYTFSKLTGSKTEKPDVTAVVLTYLEKHFTETDLHLSKVAKEAGYNEKYLSHIFKKQFGTTFSRYLRLMRIKHAVLLIENGVTSVKNIAYLSGFSDPLYFSKVFTEQMGTSPRQFIADTLK